MNNDDLQSKYDEIYADGPENFHSMTTEDVTRQVVAEFDWHGKRVLEVGCGAMQAMPCVRSAAACGEQPDMMWDWTG